VVATTFIERHFLSGNNEVFFSNFIIAIKNSSFNTQRINEN